MNALSLWGLAVLAHVTAITLAAAVLMAIGSRRAAWRHTVGTAALWLVIASPVSALLLPRPGWFPRPSGLPEIAAGAPELSKPSTRFERSSALDDAPFPREPQRPSADDAPGDFEADRRESPTAAATPSSDRAARTGDVHAVSLGSILGNLALLVWIGGAFIAACRCWRRQRGVIRMARSWQQSAPEGPLSELLREAASIVGLKQPPPLGVSDIVPLPLVLGLWQPAVVLPRAIAESASAARLREVLIHECAHIVRGDPWVLRMQQLAAVVFWLHPGVHWLNRQIARAREEICDNFVLQAGNAADYAQTLLDLATSCRGERWALSVLGLFHQRWTLEQRICGLLDPRRETMTRTRRRTMVGLTMLFGLLSVSIGGRGVIASALAQSEPQKPSAEQQGDEKPASDHPTAATGENPIRGSGAANAAGSRLPTVREVLAIHRANQAKLSQLHLQLVQTYGRTPEAAHEDHKRAVQLEAEDAFYSNLSNLTDEELADLKVKVEGKTLTGRQALNVLKGLEFFNRRDRQWEIDSHRNSKPFRKSRLMELFLNGENYQYRELLRDPEAADQPEGAFPELALTPETLVGPYRNVGIFSYASDSEPPARWWYDRRASVMHKHLTDVSLVHLPPYMSVAHPRWDRRHLIDTLFLGAEENCRVVKHEEIDGRLLTVVDSLVTGENEPRQLLRGWLDLSRGAVPIRIFATQVLPTSGIDTFDAWEPENFATTYASTLATSEIRELPNGGFYPIRTVREDRRAPVELLNAKTDGSATGQRPRPSAIVHHRYTWECSLVEVKTDWGPNFFVIPFPEGQQIHNRDADRQTSGFFRLLEHIAEILFEEGPPARQKPATPRAKPAKTEKSDQDRLQGKWQLQSIAIQDKLFKREDKLIVWQEAFDTDFLVEGDRIGQGDPAKGKFTLDDSRTPKQITIQDNDGNLNFLGIYEIDGDTLKMCFDGHGTKGSRPENFAAKGPTIVTVTLKKKADAK